MQRPSRSEEPGVLIGAYERDNFGDVLFLEETRRVLAAAPSVARSPFAGKMMDLIGEDFSDYRSDFGTRNIPFIWVVGGETGGTSVREAQRMSGAAAGDPQPTGTGTTGAARALPSFASPYLPRPSRYPGSAGAALVINSVGVSGVGQLVGRRRVETVAALREANFLSVREADSSRALRRFGIDHVMAPDLVQSITQTYRPSETDSTGVALVQAKARTIQSMGVDRFAELLTSVPALRSFRVRLFSAGEAPGHDSTPLLLRVAEHAASLRGGRAIFEVSSARTPREKVDEIASAGLWIGTSLHGYIVSTAYSVPRVGLLFKKLSRYAETWGIPHPAAVGFSDLDDAVQTSLGIGRLGGDDEIAHRLAALAIENSARARNAAISGFEMVERLVEGRLAHRRRTDLRLGAAMLGGSLIDRAALFGKRASRALRSG